MDETGLRLCEITKELWHSYLLGGGPSGGRSIFDDDCVVIGTGRHEFYESAEEFLGALAADLAESSSIDFQIADEWYDCRRIGDDAYLVYGGVHVQEAPGSGHALVDMDTRFSMVFRLGESGEWGIVHVHQSLPYLDQQPGEYYPRSLSEKASEAIEFANRMRELARHDLMTGVLNHAAFFSDARDAASVSSDWWCLVVDVDDFKGVNDEWGHLEGDRVLECLAAALRGRARPGDIVGRIGGDEFAMLVRLGSREEAESFALGLEEDFRGLAPGRTKALPGLSVGFAQVLDGDFIAAFKEADGAMYSSKRASSDSSLSADLRS